MTYELAAFWAFASVTVLAALGVILARNPVHAVLSLVLTFFSAACLWLLLQAEFLGVVLVLVYIGAVMVLFLFVVMMLDVDSAPLREGYVRYLPVGLLVAVAMLVEIFILIGVKAQASIPLTPDAADLAGISNVTWLARALFTRFLLPFEVAAVILTVAVIAAVMLTLRRRPGAKHQNPGDQARVRPGDRLRMVKMEASKPAVLEASEVAAEEVKS